MRGLTKIRPQDRAEAMQLVTKVFISQLRADIHQGNAVAVSAKPAVLDYAQ